MIDNKTQTGLVLLEPFYYKMNSKFWRIIVVKSVNDKTVCLFRDCLNINCLWNQFCK